MTDIAKKLTTAEAEVLADCEETISHGLQTFVEVGTALSLIRDNRLYRADHATFEAYCQERWQLSRPRAYELMTAADVVSGMPDTDRPSNARQAVELARVPEPERAEVWARANEATEGKPTAAAIREAAKPSTPSGDRKADVQPAADATSDSEAPARAGETAAETLPATGLRSADGVDGDEGREAPRGGSSAADAAPAGAPTGLDTAGAPVIPSAVQAALDKYAPDPNPHREWQRRYFEAIAGVHRVMRFSPEDVAEKADDECVDELLRVADALADYRLKVVNARVLPDNVTPMRRTS